ncbi:MAG: radical SAM protein, partial [Pseudomonadota bacterium]
KRKDIRCQITLPIEEENNDIYGTNTIVGKLTNISKKGGRISSTAPLIPPYVFYINLPPCYSENPNQATGIRVLGELAWNHIMEQGKERFVYGFTFSEISQQGKKLISDIIDYESAKIARKTNTTTQPQINLHREMHSCNMQAVDLTVGCDHGCLYCHFAKAHINDLQKEHSLYKGSPIPVDISPIYRMGTFPRGVIYLSPSSDPFGNSAKRLTHKLLEFFLPKGMKFAISTKAIIPNETLELLAKYLNQIEIEVGIANLSQERNDIIEKNCPTVKERLKQLQRLASAGYNPGVRMDPLFPIIDDSIDSLEATVKAIANTGTKYISTAYIFSFGRFLKSLKKEPFLRESIRHLTQRCYVAGGQALSVPIETKKQTYQTMNQICKRYGIRFAVCGCKEVSLKNTEYSLICRRVLH